MVSAVASLFRLGSERPGHLADGPAVYKAIEEVANDDEFWAEMQQILAVRMMAFNLRAVRLGMEAAASLGIEVDFDALHADALAVSRTTSSIWWGKMNETTREGLRQALLSWQEMGIVTPEQQKRGLPTLIESLEPLFGPERANRIAATEVTRLFAEGNELAVADDGAIGGMQWQTARDEKVCFPASTLVTTADGEKPIERMRPGDVVLSAEGWRRVRAVCRRRYAGPLVRLEAGGRSLTATSNHPVWVLEKGWLEAGQLKPGDCLQFVDNERSAVGRIPHLVFTESQDSPAPGGERPFLPGVPARVLVPVSAVHLHSDAVGGQGEVDAVASDTAFLHEEQAHRCECLANGLFQQRLPRRAAIAGQGTELPVGVHRLSSEACPAGGASDVYGWAAAFLAAIVAVEALFGCEHPTATLAGDVLGLRRPALTAAHGIAVGDDGRHTEIPAASRAMLGGHDCGATGFVALPPAVSLVAGKARGLAVELLAALGAGSGFALAGRKMVARLRTKSSSLALGLESLLAVCASPFHRTPLYRALCGTARGIEVYNLEVEGSPTYFANGILVHNCKICKPLDGHMYPKGSYPESIGHKPPGHTRCRCGWVPVTWDYIRQHKDKWHGGPIPVEAA